jgi:anaerobic ribonucleoside-triphosphate reductase activating protein
MGIGRGANPRKGLIVSDPFCFTKDMKMLIHGMMKSSEVNGPGKRAVIWTAGCSLACKNCWNPETHAFDIRKETSIGDIQKWIMELTDVEGLTWSGGEPMQQAPYLYALVAWIREHRPDLTIGMYTGYSKKELENGTFKWKSAYDADWVRGSTKLWHEIKQHLDFAVVGRYVDSMACHDEPLRGSRNQEVLFYTEKYKEADLPPQTAEVTVGEDGLVQITGYPTVEFLDDMRNKPVPVSVPMSSKPVACVKDKDDSDDFGELVSA